MEKLEFKDLPTLQLSILYNEYSIAPYTKLDKQAWKVPGPSFKHTRTQPTKHRLEWKPVKNQVWNLVLLVLFTISRIFGGTENPRTLFHINFKIQCQQWGRFPVFSKFLFWKSKTNQPSELEQIRGHFFISTFQTNARGEVGFPYFQNFNFENLKQANRAS